MDMHALITENAEGLAGLEVVGQDADTRTDIVVARYSTDIPYKEAPAEAMYQKATEALAANGYAVHRWGDAGGGVHRARVEHLRQSLVNTKEVTVQVWVLSAGDAYQGGSPKIGYATRELGLAAFQQGIIDMGRRWAEVYDADDALARIRRVETREREDGGLYAQVDSDFVELAPIEFVGQFPA